MPTATLSDGTKLTTASNRRFVTFTIADDSRVTVQKRTDNRATAAGNHADHCRRGFLRIVTVDLRPFGTINRDTGRYVPAVLWDSAEQR
jgi:hypothetical protein